MRALDTDMFLSSLLSIISQSCKGVGRKWHRVWRGGTLLCAGLLLCGFWTEPVLAQTGVVTGTVTDAEGGESLPGVNVVIVGTERGSSTDAEGNYTISSLEPGTYQVRASFIGYETMTKSGVQVEAGETTTLNFALTTAAQQLEDVVVVGYSQQREENLSTAVGEVESQELAEVTVANNTDKLAGRVAGLVTRQTSGLPGADFRNLEIRGFGNPLVLVDGVEMRMSQIDPSTIESITVLKDAAAAVYGMRAGNGVILVETKRGEEGQAPTFNYSSTLTAQAPTQVPEQVSAGQYAEMLTQAEELYNQSRTFRDREVDCYKNPSSCENPEEWQSYDWYDAIFNKWTPQHEHNLNVQGGTERVNYFVSGGFLRQGSAFVSGDVGFERWSGRSNVDVDVSERVTASLDFSYRREVRERPGRGFVDIWNSLQKARPWMRPTLPDTSLAAWTGLSAEAPLGSIDRDKSGFQESEHDFLNGRLELSWNLPVEGLSTTGELSYFFQSQHSRDFARPFGVYRYEEELEDPYVRVATGGPTNSSISEGLFRIQRFKPVARVDYSRNFGSHSIDGFAVAEWISQTRRDVGASRQNLLSNELPYIFVGRDDESKDNYGGRSKFTRQSYASRLTYSFDDRYILEGTFRADGSYKFEPGSRWGYFPSVSAAWRIGEESFMQGTAFDDLKLRLSFSETGDDDPPGAFQYISGFDIVTLPYMIDGSPAPRVTPGTVPLSGISWLQHRQYNVGLDGSLWDGLLGFQADVYYRFTEGRFAPPQQDIPQTTGVTSALPEINFNNTADRGIDLELRHENTVGDVTYSVSPNISFTRRKRVRWAEEEFTEEWEKRVFKQEGKWARRTVGYVAVGTFDSQDEIDSWPVEQDDNDNNSLKPGDIKYKDLDGDGEITERDQKKIGNGAEPNINYGLSFDVQYAGFSLNGLFQGASMFNVNFAGRARGGFNLNGVPFTYHYDHRWTPENRDAALPAPNPTGVNNNNNRFSSFWLKDGTYLRLKNLNLSYTVPENWVDGVGLQRLRLYVAGSNLLTVDRLGVFSDAWDPEGATGGISQDGRGYPLHKTVSFGVNLSL